MKIEQSALIQELRSKTAEARSQMDTFRTYSLEDLNYKSNEQQWSILECIEHLCLYGKFYLPEIESRMTNEACGRQELFKSGFLGDYFVNMIKATNTKKIKSPQQMDAIGSELNISTINQFIKQLEWLDSLLIKAENLNLSKIKTSISLTKLVKLKLGDMLRFLVYHNERHILQAKRIQLPHKN